MENKKQVIAEFEKATNNLIKVFKQKQGFESHYFIGNDYTGVVVFNEQYTYSLEDIYLDIEQDTPKGIIIDWQDERVSNCDTSMNYHNYLKLRIKHGERYPFEYMKKHLEETYQKKLEECEKKLKEAKETFIKCMEEEISKREKNMEDLIYLIEKWAEERGFFNKENGASVKGQFVKLIEEVGELAGNITRDKDCTDDIGDIVVVLTITARLKGLTLKQCIERAYSDIKDRKGQWVNGTFVKEEDFKNGQDF